VDHTPHRDTLLQSALEAGASSNRRGKPDLTRSEHVSGEATIGEGKVVSIEYVLRDVRGKELDRSAEGKPLVYLHGAHNIVPGLERALTGKAAGDSIEARVPPEQGYGAKGRYKTQRLLRSAFPAEARVERGQRFLMGGPDGPFPIYVVKVQGREVHVTREHPLAGEVLCFSVTVRELRDATEEEKAHGHPHGPGGHSHGEHEHGEHEHGEHEHEHEHG
jgi:FKBP-type peptidyl-prolyl cis-trans isomerase SlyD